MGEEYENGAEVASTETPPQTPPPTIADELKKAGLSREEIAETMREVLAEAKAAPPVDVEAAEKEYFGSFLK